MAKHGITIEVPTVNLVGAPQWFANWMKENKREVAFNKKDEGGKIVADIALYDVIGESMWGGGISASRFSEQLKALGDVDEVRVLINSPGGLIADGMAIYTALAEHPANVITYVTGIAASAASFILQAGDERWMGETTTAFVHRAQGMTMGDDIEHEKSAVELKKLTDTIALTYARRSGRKAESFLKMMTDERLLTAQEALDEKLIDKIVPAKKAAKNEKEPTISGDTELLPVQHYKKVSAVDVRMRMMELEIATDG